MKKSIFQGGIHPTKGEDKSLTSEKTIIPYIPENVRVSLKQGLGPNAVCVVKPGERVEQGQVIGKSESILTADLHAPVTGIVTAAEEGSVEIRVESCVLPDTDAVYYKEYMDIGGISKDEIIKKLEQGGLVGMGGAGFPTHVKFKPKTRVAYLLVNAAECEPFLTCDEHMMLEQGMAILNGVQLLKKATGAYVATICMEENKRHVYAHLKEILPENASINLQLLPTRYPQGGEKQLIKAVLDAEVPSGKLPADVKTIVSNVQTVKAAADMVFAGIPSISRCITVTGDVADPENYLVPLGTSIGELIARSGDVKNKENKVILGGPMTGRHLGDNLTAQDVTETVTKVSGGLVVLPGKSDRESACIKCGACIEACPIGLKPAKIDAAERRDMLDICRAEYATECIACGCCSYVCPAKRELTYHVVQARDRVRAKMREEAAGK